MLKSPTASERSTGRRLSFFARRLGLALALPGLLCLCGNTFAQSEIELRVKAAFLYNFAKFTQWPSTPPGSPFVIGCFSDSDFMEVLRATVAGKSLDGHSVVVKRVADRDDLPGCKILFVGHGQEDQAGLLLRAATDAHVLTVGESDDFRSHGGMIQFVVADNGVKFAIDQEQAERAGLRISSKLLELAVSRRVGGG